eukprot:5943699-Alexandrium_andersonii.AAC.1
MGQFLREVERAPRRRPGRLAGSEAPKPHYPLGAGRTEVRGGPLARRAASARPVGTLRRCVA